MADTTEGLASQPLTLPEELILMLLNEETGYFHQVQGWELNCAVVGAVLAELSLLERIDTDMESLLLVDRTETGNPALDPILKEIADEPVRHNAQYWIERLASHAESIIDLTLDRLVNLKVLKHHDGDFWTLAPTSRHSDRYGDLEDDSPDQFIKTRISVYIFTEAVPDPRDIIIICLVNTCDVFRFIFDLDDEAEERIKFICRMDLIGRSIADAVEANIASPLLRRTAFTKKIPVVPLHKLLLNRHLRDRNVPGIFAILAQKYGPVFQVRPPLGEPVTVLAGAATNRWLHRNGRMYLRSKDYFTDIEKVYGASGLIPLPRRRRSLPGCAKPCSPGYSRERLEGELDALYGHIRAFMADWKVGSTLECTATCRLLVNAQIAPVILSIEAQDIVEGPDKVQGAGAHHPRSQGPAQVHAAHPGHEAARQGHRIGGAADPERPHARPEGRLPAHPRGRHAQPPRQRPAVPPRVEHGVPAFSAHARQHVPRRCAGLRALRHGVAAGALRPDQERGRCPVRRRRPGRGGLHQIGAGRHEPLYHGVHAHVPRGALRPFAT